MSAEESIPSLDDGSTLGTVPTSAPWPGMLRAVDVGVLPALGIDAQLERGTLPAIQQAEAVAQPVVLPRLGRPEADPRCSQGRKAARNASVDIGGRRR